ncbi:MAG: MotA/TolQ/ExbB proton channel family protein [Prosthecobacter sp.]|jgi:biopolymer transport protein ExbB/TolQ|nr:MotA/TolQ/ExbB proton channel family protein [Prosthecobacter sp.]
MPAAIPSFFDGLKFGQEHITPVTWGILAVLALLSTISWSALLARWLLLGRVEKANRRFLRKFHESAHPLALYLTKEQTDLSPLHYLYHAASKDLAFHLVGEEEPGRSFSTRLQGAGRISPSQMSTVQNAMERAVRSTALKLEDRLGRVATIISIAPLLGILGTLMGLLQVFSGRLAGGDAALAASGVCAALLSSIAAILVVIPSLAGYNAVVARIRGMLVRMDDFAAELSGILDRHFVDHRKVEESLPSLGTLGAPAMPVPGVSSGITTSSGSRFAAASAPRS